jgi:hypothetical protein
MSETVEPRVVFVDTQSEAVLLNTCQTADGEEPTDKAPALEWVFADSDLGVRLGQLCCSPKIELRRTNGAGIGAFARAALKAGEEVYIIHIRTCIVLAHIHYLLAKLKYILSLLTTFHLMLYYMSF